MKRPREKMAVYKSRQKLSLNPSSTALQMNQSWWEFDLGLSAYGNVRQ
jgi:hypothetical protein